MKSLWNEQEAQTHNNDPLQLRVYTSRLMGQDPGLVMHGGGNTSVKTQLTDRLGDTYDVLYVKGSGWDLGTIEAEGFAPVRQETLLKMAKLEELSDGEMVHLQRSAMLNPSAPNPSVEAILHAIIPFAFVDHSHADAVLAISHSPNGDALLQDLYGERVLFVPYVMPGFALARAIYNQTQGIDWSQYDAMVLLHHGVFTWGDDARASYERMIQTVDAAERFLQQQGATENIQTAEPDERNLLRLAQLRHGVSTLRDGAVLALWNHSPEACGFSVREGVIEAMNRGPLTPDHVIRTKPKPLHITDNLDADLQQFANEYQAYFQRHQNGQTCLDLAPRWGIWPGQGTVAFGRSLKEASIIQDINRHTARALQWSEHLGGWYPISEKDTFDMEYWELEQAKLKRKGAPAPLQGKVAMVTGGASGIGRACVEMLSAQGAAVIALDLDPEFSSSIWAYTVHPMVCDVTDPDALRQAVEATIEQFGGLDLVVSNAGNFPASCALEDMTDEAWEQSLQLNLTSHRRLLTYAAPYLKWGIDPAVVLVASKNVPAPGPGASAYSVAKAGLTQLARVAALELGSDGIRVNVVHPNAVFDTGIWSQEVIEERARRYGLSVSEYQTKNVLQTEVTSKDVAGVVYSLLSDAFAKTTGAQIPVDGGNDRVI